MRFAAVILILAAVVVGGFVYLLRDDESGHAAPSRRDGPRAGRISMEERRGFLSISLRVETADGAPAGRASIEYEGAARGSAAANADGSVRVDGLATGFFTVRARAGEELGTMRFELRETTHLGTLRLGRASVVSGRVFDVDGDPIHDATVEVIAAPGERLGMEDLARAMGEPDVVAARATTNSRGEYSIKIAGGRRYALRAIASGYAVDLKAAQRFTRASDIDFYLRPGAVVSGSVVDDRGFAVGGAQVMVFDPGRIAAGVPKAETRTATSGSFELTLGTDGSAMLVARAPGFAPHFNAGVRRPSTGLRIALERGVSVWLRVVADEGGQPVPGISVAVDLEGGFAIGKTTADGTLSLSNLPSRRDPAGGGDHVILWGTDWEARVHPITAQIPASGSLDLGDFAIGRGGTLHGRVVTPDNSPVSGATVRVFGGLPPAIAMAASPTAVSEGDGTYHLRGVPLGATHVLAFHAEYAPPDSVAALLSGQAAPGGGRLFAGDQNEAQRDIVLQPQARIRGVVKDGDGKPVAGAIVRCLEAGAAAAAFLGGSPAEATTDADGRFELGGLATGPMSLVATHADKGSSVPQTVATGESAALKLRAPHTVRGTVVDERGQPIGAVRVAVEAHGLVVLTDRSGVFVLRNVPDGPARVRLDHPGYASAEHAIEVAQPEQQLDDLTLVRGPGIEGIVVDESGKPVPGVAVMALLVQGAMGQGRGFREATSGEDGQFSIHGLSRGNFKLECRKVGFFAEAPMVAAGSGKRAKVVLRAAAIIEGTVVSGGEPVAGAQVSVGEFGMALSRVDGTFVVSGLPHGVKADVVVLHDGYREARAAGVTPGKPVVIELDAGIQVGGTVEFADGTPVPGALVEILAGTVQVRLVQTDANAEFLAGGLPEGELKARVLESGLGLLARDAVRASVGNRSLRLVAERGESITGMVYGVDGQPAGSVRVLAIADGGKVVASAWIDRPGAGYALHGLRPGSYTVRAERERGEARTELQGVGSGGRDVDLRFEK